MVKWWQKYVTILLRPQCLTYRYHAIVKCWFHEKHKKDKLVTDPDFNPKEAKKMEEELKKMEKKTEKRTFKATAKAVALVSKLSPKAQRKQEALLNSTAQLKVIHVFRGFRIEI